MRVEVDRSKWRRGGSAYPQDGTTRLKNERGLKCCLGFATEQSGVSLVRVGWFREIMFTYPSELRDCRLSWLIELEIAASEINDAKRLSDATREKRLSSLFAEHGHEMVFVGEYRE